MIELFHYTLCISGPANVPPYDQRSRFYKEKLKQIEHLRGRPTWLMTGCAFGIDTDVLRAALEIWEDIGVIFAVPDAPHNTAMVAFLQASYHGPMEEHVIKCSDPSVGKRYMARNEWMSEHAHELAAFPRTGTEAIRSGTWSTIRRFRKRGKPVHLYPTGEFNGL